MKEEVHSGLGSRLRSLGQGLPEFLVHRHDLEGKMGDLVGYILLVSKTSGRNETKGAPEQGSLKHRTQKSYLAIIMM